MLRSLRLTRPLAAKHLRACSLSTKGKKAAASLGVVRLDYDYPPAPGDIDSPESYGYDVFYRAVPGLSFEMCQHAVPKTGTPLPDDVMKGFVEAIKYLDQEKNVSGSTRLAPRTRARLAPISAPCSLSLSLLPHASRLAPPRAQSPLTAASSSTSSTRLASTPRSRSSCRRCAWRPLSPPPTPRTS